MSSSRTRFPILIGSPRLSNGPVPAAAAAMAAFAAGALIPLLPYLLGYASLAARQSGQPFLRGALRHLLLGAVAVGVTYLIGHLAGTTI